jgi:DNA-binding CsgD family transcriptional regulator
MGRARCGYVNKQVGGARLIQAIREVFEGRVVLSPALTTQLLEEYSGQPRRDTSSPLTVLTDREFEVFRLLGEAKTTREIADQLHLSCKTVETHRLKTLRKLRLKNSAELIRYASLHVEQQNTSPQDKLGAQPWLRTGCLRPRRRPVVRARAHRRMASNKNAVGPVLQR